MPNEAQESASALLDEIARVTGMPFPNLLHRRLAEDPPRLRACWMAVAPGLHAVSGARLRADLLRPFTSLPSAATGPAPLTPLARQLLLDVLENYDRGNSCNAVVVGLLLRGTPGNEGVEQPVRSTPALSWPPAPALPPMVSVEAMTSGDRATVLRLAALLDGTRAVVPSLLRHLPAEPELLDAVASVLLAAERSGDLAHRTALVRREVARLAERWPTPVAPVADASTRSLLATFDAVIPRMLAVSTLLREAVGS